MRHAWHTWQLAAGRHCCHGRHQGRHHSLRKAPLTVVLQRAVRVVAAVQHCVALELDALARQVLLKRGGGREGARSSCAAGEQSGQAASRQGGVRPSRPHQLVAQPLCHVVICGNVVANLQGQRHIKTGRAGSAACSAAGAEAAPAVAACSALRRPQGAIKSSSHNRLVHAGVLPTAHQLPIQRLTTASSLAKKRVRALYT